MFGDGRFKHLDLGTTSANTCFYPRTAVSGSATLGQLLPVIRFAWKTVAEMAENRDLGRAPPNITSSGSLEMVGSGILI